MPSVLLIHGFGVGVKPPKIQLNYSKYGGFQAFERLIEEKKAIVFYWAIPKKFNYLWLINPFLNLKLYKEEKIKAKNPENLANLHNFIEQNQPEIIICHSMGCFMFLEYIKIYNLAKSVKKVVFAQADLSKNFSLPKNVIEKIENGEVIFENYFCFWDQALFSSMLINFYLPAGLVGAKRNNLIKNQFFGLHKLPNLHEGILAQNDFLEKSLRL